jgi:hypothetical protein
MPINPCFDSAETIRKGGQISVTAISFLPARQSAGKNRNEQTNGKNRRIGTDFNRNFLFSNNISNQERKNNLLSDLGKKFTLSTAYASIIHTSKEYSMIKLLFSIVAGHQFVIFTSGLKFLSSS